MATAIIRLKSYGQVVKQEDLGSGSTIASITAFIMSKTANLTTHIGEFDHSLFLIKSKLLILLLKGKISILEGVWK